MKLSLTILGSSSAIPISARNPTSQFLTLANRHFLIDCGEGTQVQLRRNRIGFGRINHILISHLHGDHFYGLVPLLTSLHLLDRTKEMIIYGPADTQKAVSDLLAISGTRLRFPLIFKIWNPERPEQIYEDSAITITSIPLDHSMPCCGFLFREKPLPRNFRKELLEKYSISGPEIKKIKAGADWEDDQGNVIKNKDLTLEPRKPLSYLFCTDTAPVPRLKEMTGTDISLMYHEATFTEEHKKRAQKTRHSTAKQAAEIAKSVNPRHLLIGHFSVRYENLDELLKEAREVFPETHLALEGCTFSVSEKRFEVNGGKSN